MQQSTSNIYNNTLKINNSISCNDKILDKNNTNTINIIVDNTEILNKCKRTGKNDLKVYLYL